MVTLIVKLPSQSLKYRILFADVGEDGVEGVTGASDMNFSLLKSFTYYCTNFLFAPHIL